MTLMSKYMYKNKTKQKQPTKTKKKTIFFFILLDLQTFVLKICLQRGTSGVARNGLLHPVGTFAPLPLPPSQITVLQARVKPTNLR